MFKSAVIIPARLSSVRFPDKPLKKILGFPMVAHCFLRANFCKDLSEDIYVATCDKEINDYVNSIGGKVIMTSKKHKRASTRTQEALEILNKKNITYQNVIMLQGDEPLVKPNHIKKILLELNKGSSDVVNLVYEVKTQEMFLDKNNVKVIHDENNYAIYFSREAIPSNWQSNSLNKRFLQSGIIGFTNSSLNLFNSLKESFLEIEESVDLNRLIENGKKIKLIKTSDNLVGVDTFQDLKVAEKFLKNDPITKKYLKLLNL